MSTSLERRFFAEVWDSSGTGAEGVLENIQAATVTKRLDAAGEFTVTLPATDSHVIDLVSVEKRIVLYEVDADNKIVTPAIVEGIIQNIVKTAQGNTPTWQVSGLDRMEELNWLSTQRARIYDNVATSSIIGTTASGTGLLRDTGWASGSVSPSVTPVTVSFDSQTILTSLLQLTKATGDHIREGTTARTLDYGTFGGAAVCLLVGLDQVRADLVSTDDTAYIAQIAITDISADIENRSYPQGSSGFDLRDAPTSITDILVRASRGPSGASTTVAAGGASATTVNVNSVVGFTAEQEIWLGDADDWTQAHETAVIQTVGATSLTVYTTLANTYASGADVLQAPQFYIEDTASQATYGVREGTPSFAWIGPGEGESETAIRQQAAATLYSAAQARLTRYKDKYEAYTLGQVLRFPTSVRPGDKVNVQYSGIIQYFSAEFWTTISQDMFVLSITRAYQGNGAIDTSLEVASVIRPTPNNVNLLVYNLDTLNWITPR